MEKFEKLTIREEILDTKRSIVNSLQKYQQGDENANITRDEINTQALRLEKIKSKMKWYHYITIGYSFLVTRGLILKYLPVMDYLATVEKEEN